MLNWLFKKRGAAVAKPSAPPPMAAPVAPVAPVDRVAPWQARLAAARGDDAALLALACEATVLEIKLAAVESLHGEEALKQAEREFRRHDRRVHRVARRRLDAAVTQRESRAKAETLIDAVHALAGEALLPLNRLAQLDRGWQALDATLLDAGQAERFDAARTRLDRLMHERDERRLRELRWVAEATTLLSELRPGLAHAAAQGQADDLAALVRPAQALRERRPDAGATAAPDQALQAWLQAAAQVQERLALIASLAPPGDAEAAAASDDLPAPTAAERWRALPPLADAELARLLDERFAQQQPPPLPPPSLPAAAAAKRARPAAAKRADSEQLAQIDALLLQAEEALAAGHLEPMPQQLAAIDSAFDVGGRAPVDEARRARRQALAAEFARLRSWQQWGGARIVDALVDEAQALAQATTAAADPPAEDAPRLNLERHGEAIRDLRARWNALDSQHAAAGAAQWRRFDAALQAAYVPIAARQAAQKAERRDNLAAREALLDALDALVLEPPADAGMPEYWKTQIRTLERFRADWRALGPLEHRVPRESRDALRQRLQRSIERIEAPLAQARAAAALAREPLIEAAQALAQEVAAQPQVRDAASRARALQAEWARQARELALAHGVETALWTRFRVAIDAVFTQRQAAEAAVEAELAANLAAREALVDRLTALTPDTPVAELRRTLAEVDAGWRQGVELPRGTAGAIETRFSDARGAVQRWIAGGAARRWQSQCDTLAARLALCEAREDGSAEAELAPQWDAQGALPAPWERALAQRWAAPVATAPRATTAFDELLLQLEVALDLPATPEWQAARRELKLRAMKDTLEGRAAATQGPVQQAAWLVDALAQAGLGATQRERLHAIVAALRQAPPGTLGTSTRGD